MAFVRELMQGAAIVAAATALFLVAFAVHVALWRGSDLRRSGSTLVPLFAGSIVLECLLLAVPAARAGVPAAALVLAALLALQIAACYVISYPAMQANSPSLEMTRQLSRAGSAGLAPAELYARLSEPSLVSDRIDDLLGDGLAIEADGRYRCTPKGAALARALAAWKALLGEAKGG